MLSVTEYFRDMSALLGQVDSKEVQALLDAILNAYHNASYYAPTP